MANILSTAQLVQKFIDYYKLSQPNLSTNVGSVARDLFVEANAIRIAELYNELLNISSSQSISNSVGSDLDNIASNYNVSRLEPGKSSGPVLLTFNSLFTDIIIPAGSLCYSRNGLSFRIIAGAIISVANESQYKALATNFKSDLDFVGLTDNYAIQIFVECTTTGIIGNIPKYNLYSVSIPGISGATNITPFAGGSSPENDGAYKQRMLSVFSGSNTGTSLGYKNLVLSNPAVLDAVVIGPGDPLMTRDDTILKTDSNGDLVISNGEPIVLSEGTGGKVDICVYGRRITENLDSFIYNDKSGKNDPTQSINDFTIGQIAGDANKTITKRRYENIKNVTIPTQPVQNIIEVTGSLSGNFTSQVIGAYGNSIGNYTLLKDTGTYAGSVFGFDKLHWVRNYSTTTQDISRNTFNGQDTLSYSQTSKITDLHRTILVTNENSTVYSLDRSQIILNHIPIRAINKVLNFTNGERYLVTNRNPGGNTGDLNYSGKIIISGKNLPSVSDILQVDYEWDYVHDIFNDIDSFTMNDNPRTAIDVVDWGYGNAIRREPATLEAGYVVQAQHLISSVISVNKVDTDSYKLVDFDTTGTGLVITGLSIVLNVVSVKRNLDGAELYNTKIKDGSFDGNKIILPSDTSAQKSNAVTVVYNAVDLYTVNGLSGNFKNNVIYLTTEAQTIAAINSTLEINYIANVSEILPATNLSSLPVNKYNNAFSTTVAATTAIGVQPVTNIYVGPYPTNNLRRTPSKLGVNISNITSNGVLNITGKTVKLLKDILFTNVDSGLKIDFELAIKQAIGIDLQAALPANLKVSRLISLENVTDSSGIVSNVNSTYDITGYGLKDNYLVLNESIVNNSLTPVEVLLPITANNSANTPMLGDRLRASFYIAYDEDSESISFSTNGTIYSEKSFAYIKALSISSGFKNVTSIAGSVSLFALSQPQSGNRYKAYYTYTSPQAGERITIRYNNNALISDLTTSLEDKRPITADVIIKSALYILADVTASITVTTEYIQSNYIVAQNVGDKINSYINSLTLGAILHPSDIVNIAYQVPGLDSIVILRFNEANKTGNVSELRALRTEYMQANNIQINL